VLNTVTSQDLTPGNDVSRPDADPSRGDGADTPSTSSSSKLRDVIKAVRPYQWVKNLLLFVPIVMAHKVSDRPRLTHVVLAFAAFCLCASASYVLNDLWDREHDRHHPVKRNRPFASGRLSVPTGVVMSLALFAAGLVPSLLLLPGGFTAMLLLYVALTTLYSFWLKRKLLLDVFFLAGLYTHRVLAGGQAAEVEVSKWLLAFCIFFFLSLAFAKRFAELLRLQDEKAGEQIRGRAYRIEDLAVMSAVGPGSGYLSVLVLALYVNQSPEAAKLYQSPSLLWLLCPVMLYWITRVWFLASRRQLSEDPILFAIKDRVSLLTVGAAMLLLVLATVGVPGVK
jgi:4-hydroxybenzoate polyprenyltransferase